MLSLNRITTQTHPNLKELIALYEQAFPEEERRQIYQLKQLIDSEPDMYFNQVLHEKELAGLFIYWKLDDFYFLEHLTTFSTLRNKGIGQKVLRWAFKTLKGEKLLETEPDKTEIAAHRLMYYQRNGFHILDTTYKQPSYYNDGKEYSLWIMGNNPEVLHNDLQSQIKRIKDKVYYRK